MKANSKTILAALGGLVFLAFPQVVTNPYYLYVINRAMIYVVVVLGMVILFGFTGQISLGQVAFFAIGAYTSALVGLRFGVTPWLTLWIGALFATVFGLILAIPSFRLKGPFLAIVTIGFGQITYLTINNWKTLTGGTYGLPNIPSLKVAGSALSDAGWFYLGAVSVALVTYATVTVRRSRVGRAFLAVREDEVAAGVMGINVRRVKTLAFAMSAFLGGLAGSLYAHLSKFLSPESFTDHESNNFLLMTVLGGLDKITGGIASALFVTIFPEVLKSIQRYYLLVFSFIVLILIVYPLDETAFYKKLVARLSRGPNSSRQGGGIPDGRA